MSRKHLSFALAVSGGILLACAVAQQHDLGFTDTPILPNLPWHVHDPARPHPRVVTPANSPGGAPSDAIVLFDGKDLSQWVHHTRTGDEPARWHVADGYMEVARNAGDLYTREKFGDCQLHVEWASPAEVRGSSQSRGNSGVYLMSNYEIQVLDAWQNPTYADGQAGAIYGQWPPLVNPARQPGEWNTYDILFDAPRFEDGKLARPAYVTVIYNGVVVHHHKELMGPTVYRALAQYKPHGAEEPLELQDHGNPVRFRNIWIRRIGQYDAPEKP